MYAERRKNGVRIHDLVGVLFALFVMVSCSSPDIAYSPEKNSANQNSDQSKEVSRGISDTPKRENPNTPNSGQEPQKNEPLPEELTQLMKELTFPVYEGNDPPTVDGYYRVTGTVVASEGARPSGSEIDTYISLWTVSPGRVGYENSLIPSEGRGNITGQNNRFTIFVHATSQFNSACSVFFIISGRKEEENLYTTYLVFYTSLPDSGCQPKGAWEKEDLVWKPAEKPTKPPPKPDEKQNDDEPKPPQNPTNPPPPPPPPFP